MFLSSTYSSQEEKLRNYIIKFSETGHEREQSASERYGLEHFLEKEVYGSLESHKTEIKVVGRKKVSKLLTKKILMALWDIAQFLDDKERALILQFILDNQQRFNIESDVSFKLRLSSKQIHVLYLQEQLERNQNFLINLVKNKYTLKDNESHWTILEILQELRLHYSVSRIPKAQKPQFKKGYRDHGSLADISTRARRLQNLEDINNLEAHLEKERREKEQNDLYLLILGSLI